MANRNQKPANGASAGTPANAGTPASAVAAVAAAACPSDAVADASTPASASASASADASASTPASAGTPASADASTPASAGTPLSISDLLAIAQRGKRQERAEKRGNKITQPTRKEQATPCNWPAPLVELAGQLNVVLPDRFPIRGKSLEVKQSNTLSKLGNCFVAAPRDDASLNKPSCEKPKRGDAALIVLWRALHNNWFGHELYGGESAAEGGNLPLAVLLQVLATEPSFVKLKWAHTLIDKRNCILQHVADVAGRFAILTADGTIQLVRNFYGDADQISQPDEVADDGETEA